MVLHAALRGCQTDSADPLPAQTPILAHASQYSLVNRHHGDSNVAGLVAAKEGSKKRSYPSHEMALEDIAECVDYSYKRTRRRRYLDGVSP
jgi:hypothetical protein